MNKVFLLFLLLFCGVINHAQTEENVQKTRYIYRPLLNGQDLRDWFQEQGITILSDSALHVTLAYSREGLENWSEVISTEPSYYSNSDPEYLRELDFFGEEKSILVLKLNAPELVERWQELVTAGAKWDWPLFEPHVTLTYDAQEVDLEQIAPYYGELIFGPEVYVEK
jgi:2'-5' RNA ligase